MKTLFLFFNHSLTEAQEQAAYDELRVDRIVSPPADIQRIWTGIPPDAESLAEILDPLMSWLAGMAKADDFLLVQGDFGACFLVAARALEKGLVPIYSTTRRNAREEHLEDGSVRTEHHFKHVRFRRYGD